MFARANSAWFATLFEMRHGTPSADTFRRVFEVLDPRELEDALPSRIALKMLKRSPERLSLNLKRKKAAWERDDMSRLLAGGI